MNKNYWALDIETYGNLDLISKLPSVEPSKSLKDEAKIKADIEKKMRAQVSKMGLSPLFGKIACICLVNCEGEKVTFAGTDEKDILTKFNDWLENPPAKSYRKLITYNGKGFDLPFIFKRMAILGISELDNLQDWNNRYKTDKHIDLMIEFCGHSMSDFIKLDVVADIILGEKKIEFDVFQIGDLIQDPIGLETVCEYCMKDTELTLRLAQKLGY